MHLSGGCQCGAVRFRVEGQPPKSGVGRASICWCRMCQKAFAGPFGALVTVEVGQLTWTRGERAIFQSSDKIQRGFCAACGTPLTYEWSEDRIDLAVFAFDDPSAVEPAVQLATESRPAWMEHLADMAARPALGPSGPVVSRQHPDHDT
ncbi:GFA family protein [uncultured Caulobacter sp.]|uniref:GFA family protein n=1 Tax=uncultured Caulobacter sp. TaxID=158749 RepID=UPI00260F5231|nr:GFA family protein [uncultured Caulobacter sp.]